MSALAQGGIGQPNTGQTTALLFQQVDDGYGIEVINTIDRHRYTLHTAERVSLQTIPTQQFLLPVDTAIAVRTTAITLPTAVPIYIRDADGSFRTEVTPFTHQEFLEGTFELELSAPIKCCLRAEGPISVSSTATQTQIDFSDEQNIEIGAYSYRSSPVATVTTTEKPIDIMNAVSTFGAALKTTKPERSYPSYRGHPPTIELGDELHIPSELTPPDTGLTLELPADYRFIYTAAPLAYYLGAELKPATVPRLIADTGFEHTLDTARGFEQEIERVLKQVFLLDCITRTEGMYPVKLRNRQAVETHVDCDFAALYDLPLLKRIETYLEIPFSVLENRIPDWKLTSHIKPASASVEMLPFVVNDLTIVRTPRPDERSPVKKQELTVEAFLRNSGFTRNAADSSADNMVFVQPESTDSLEQVWIGDGTPLGASKATTEAYRNRLNRTPTDGDIEITVVCNDSVVSHPLNEGTEMNDEIDSVSSVYGSRADLPFSVSIHRNLTVDECRSVLRSSTDFFHYVGHIDDGGFACTDGKLDAATLETVGADAFLLNACRSYEQGISLIEAGSIGGFTTYSDISNSSAVSMGRTLAGLLNSGFSLRTALELAHEEHLIGGQYIVVGDGGLTLAQAESGTPYLCEINNTTNSFEVELTMYPTTQLGMGTEFIPYIQDNSEYFLNSGKTDTFFLSGTELNHFLGLENFPVRINDTLCWSKDIEADDLL